MCGFTSFFSGMTEMGCCGCFGFFRKPHRLLIPFRSTEARLSQELLLPDTMEENDEILYNGDGSNFHFDGNHATRQPAKRSEEILLSRALSGLICREILVKETKKVTLSEDILAQMVLEIVEKNPANALLVDHATRSKQGKSKDLLALMSIYFDEDGNKMVNEYVRQRKIGSGSYAKVVLYHNTKDGKQYAIKIIHKSHLSKLRVAPSETAMSDVLREVSIMKMLNHPNIVNLVEVIDDSNIDQFYMVLEYVEGKWTFDGRGPADALGESTSRGYLRDIVAGLMYLHAHNIVHGDIKPDNLLVTSSGNLKIGDFSVSQVFEDDNDVLRRSPGTPVFTAPECCLGLTYRGKMADTWAVGVTLYCMIFGKYPFLGETLQETYDKIVNNPFLLPVDISPELKDLLEGLLCKDPKSRISLKSVSEHPWVTGDEGPIAEYPCWCRRRSSA